MKVPLELKIKYLSRRIQDIQKLKLSLDQNDFSWALKLGHQIKGNAQTFGVNEMTFIAAEMEVAAKKQDKDKVNTLIQKMETFLKSAQSNYL